MTEKELRRLSKTDMLSMIRDQEAELLAVRNQVAELQKKLDEKTLQTEQCGSLADAALQLNGVFQAAQASADQYLYNVKAYEEAVDARLREKEAEADQEISRRLQNAQEHGRQIEMQAREKASAYWNELQARLEKYYESHEGLKAMLDGANIKIHIPGMLFDSQPGLEEKDNI